MRYLCLAMRRRVNTSDLHEVASAIGPQTKLVWLESPTNPRQQISDIRVRVALFQS
jgi:cystathionine beta-lyase/cystathionine gamma-synthase